MAIYKRYTREQYLKGNPKFNLLLNERRLLLGAIKKSNWNRNKARKLNFPLENISISAYNYILLRHHINIKEKTYKKLTEIN
jgi:hypothetical protein